MNRRRWEVSPSTGRRALELHTAPARRRARSPALLARLLLACAALGSLAPSPIEAQACLGFGGDGFLGAAGELRREWSENTNGLGGAAGLTIGRLAAAGHYLKFSGADEYDQEFDFESARATVAYEFGASSFALCPVLSFGSEGISSRGFRSFPYRSKPYFGGGLAVGRRYGAPDAGLAIIPSITITIENHVVERIIEGDISIDPRETDALVRGGITVEFGRLYVRPHAAFIVVEDGWVTGGARIGVRF